MSATSITSNPGWNASTTAEEVASALSSSIAGKTILVTGVLPGGLGAHFVNVISAHHPKLLILADRSGPKLAEFAQELETAHPGVAIRTLEIDLSSQAEIRKAAAEVLSWPEAIDVLVNNAGVMSPTYQKTADGLEIHFGTNYIGHFLFTNLIMPKLLESKSSPRVVNVSSDGHRLSDIRWDDLNFQDGKVYNMWRAYGQSKTALMLFSVELAHRLGSKGFRTFSIHPGAIWTNLSRFTSDKDWAGLKALDQELGHKQGSEELKTKNFSQGTATHVVAAFDPKLDEHNGVYLQDCQLAPSEEVEPYAVDKASAKRLWSLSEKIVGQSFSY
ncbi:short-chain dehydrogenase [Lentinus tigrinus ALCF2SS1-7]|uniref:Short-chain dehydrogenase n=1 Tax=Lentinus tigrinus ALCF2SS1-6 TaxID=1328759 RepID=A0A5C2S440_9APHY|nr:short-chain dehydrogenase [Lentinus tigrinus ALCF2SS1-6]RPD72905.1 short-chain dehydrogenase [Lentinus tigrinus ALCF2SS1-7]